MSTSDSGASAHDLQQQIGKGLVQVAPPGWVELRCTCIQVGKTSELRARAVLENGEQAGLSGLGFPLSDGFYDLRPHFYQPGKGAWYTAVCTVTSFASISFDFDDDSEPQWDIDVVPATYVEDLEMFPRDKQHRPDWLKDKLRLAGG